MIRSFIAAILTVVLAFVGCGAPSSAPNDSPSDPSIEGVDMPGYVMITAADAGPGAPFTSIECPDDGVEASGEDLQKIAAACLATDEYLLDRVNLVNPGFFEAAEDSSTKVWTTITIDANGAHLDIPLLEAGDVLFIVASANVAIRDDDGTSPSASGGLMYLYATQDLGTGTPTAIVGNRRAISQDLGAGPRYQSMAFNGQVVITDAGTCRVELRGTVNNAADQIQLLDWNISVYKSTPT
jgi:ketosteroid isomerase-like protein